MAEAVSLDTVIIASQTDLVPSPVAGDIITSVRDTIPDPVYSDTGIPEPDQDGSFLRAQTLYRWLTSGIRDLSRRINWVVSDWTARPTTNMLPLYQIDRRWHNLDAVFCNQFRCTYLDEAHTIYPSFLSSQPLWWSLHRRTDQYELALWPAPNSTDAVVSLPADITATATAITVSDASDFLSFGWVMIGVELIQYFQISTNTIQVVKRGAGGTPAMVHYAGDAVTHCSCWVRGPRTPVDVAVSTDIVEIPLAFVPALETYLLSRVRDAEQDRATAQSLMQDYNAQVKEIMTDPIWQQSNNSQLAAYGCGALEGNLYYGRVIVP